MLSWLGGGRHLVHLTSQICSQMTFILRWHRESINGLKWWKSHAVAFTSVRRISTQSSPNTKWENIFWKNDTSSFQRGARELKNWCCQGVFGRNGSAGLTFNLVLGYSLKSRFAWCVFSLPSVLDENCRKHNGSITISISRWPEFKSFH